jgi:hypothetical protein
MVKSTVGFAVFDDSVAWGLDSDVAVEMVGPWNVTLSREFYTLAE